jgi:hypothetical protein
MVAQQSNSLHVLLLALACRRPGGTVSIAAQRR